MANPLLATTPDVVLVSCAAKKLEQPSKAKDLYTKSRWFSALRSYAEATGKPWKILSAKYGLLYPEDVVEPYNHSLKDKTPPERREWGYHVLTQISGHGITGGRIQVLAGEDYRRHLVPMLKARGFTVDEPLARTPSLDAQAKLATEAANHLRGAPPMAWSSPRTVGDQLAGRHDLPPPSAGVYVITRQPWTSAPDATSQPLYVGGNTSTEARFRTRVGDLLIDLAGYYSSPDEARTLGMQPRGHHSGAQTIREWCHSNGVQPHALYVGWATRPDWCGRCAEVDLYRAWKPLGFLECNRIPPTACKQHGAPQREAAPATARTPRKTAATGSRADLSGLTRGHYLAALQAIDHERQPGGRYAAGWGAEASTKYDVVHDGVAYPPKLVTRYAMRLLLGGAGEIVGGDHVNEPLRRAGFTVRKRT